VIPQGGAGVVLAEQAAPLQFGDHESAEVLERPRKMGGADDEAVAGRAAEPLLEHVGGVFRTADPGVAQPSPAAEAHEVAGRRVRIAADLQHPVSHILHPGDAGDLLTGEGFIQALAGEVEVQPF
jgi:hypothetical protein